MPSTYTTNNGIELPATGEQSGTWGDTVNANMAIVDRLVTGVGTITLSGTTHTLTTTSGTLSDGMYRVLVFSGSPSGTNTVTISPNTQQKLYIVKNSSGQSIVLTQGSGGNVTVANGDVKIVYANGGGASAAVVDLTADLAMSSVSITGGTIDGSVIGGSSAAAGTFTTATVGAGLVGTPSLTTTGDTNTGLYFPAADAIAATTGGTERMRITSSGNVGIGTSSPNVLLNLAGSATTALARIANTGTGASAFDGSGAGLELLAGNMNTTSKYTPAIKFGSTDIEFTTTNPKFGAAIVANATQAYASDTTGGMNLEFWTAPASPGTGSGLVERMRIDSSGNVGIGASSPKTRLQTSAAGTFNAPSLGSATGAPFYISNSDPSYGIVFGTTASDGHGWIQAQRTDATATAYNLTLNEAGGNVGIGTSSPNSKLHVNGSQTLTADYMTYMVNAYYDSSWKYVENGIAWGIGNNFGGPSNGVCIAAAASNSSGAGAALTWLPRLNIDSSGNVGVGTSAPGQKLTVAGTVESTSGGFKFPDGTTQTTAAAGSSTPSGVVMDYVGATAPSGWVLLDGRTIGSASSGATNRANSDTQTLFELLWNSMANAEAPVSTGRGASAAADFAANKTITLPDARGRVIAGKDDMGGTTASRLTSGGSGITGTTLGVSGGTQTHTLTTSQMPAHTHGITTSSDSQSGSPTAPSQGLLGDSSSGSPTGSTGGGGAHQNTQPTLVLNKIIKL